MSIATTAALNVARVTYAIGEHTILDDVNLRVSPGEVVALIGPNGAGKSTLFGVAAGDLAPAAGTVELFGDTLATLSTRTQSRRRAVQVQSHGVSYSYLVREVVAMGRWPWRGTHFSDDDQFAIDAAIDAADLHAFVTRDATTLSGGEQARTSFARMLAQQSRLVFADEPTAALDIGHQELVLGHLRAMAQQGAAVVVVLHDLNLAAAFGDRVVLLDRGRIVADGTPAEVLTDERLSVVYNSRIEVLEHPRTGQLLVLPHRSPEQEPLEVSHANVDPATV